MSWNGSGTFNRLFSWVADAAAGLDIIASRMDADTDDIASSGFGNCLTRDGQGIATADLGMGNFRHTNVGNGVARTDYAALGQAQDGLLAWTVNGGSSDALTATYTPALTLLNDGQLCYLRAISSNATNTPTFSPNGLTARTITRSGGLALNIGDIPGNLAEIILRYNIANTRWELLNPSIFQVSASRDYLSGLTLSNDAVTPNTIFDVSAGVCTSDDQTTSMALGAFTKTTSSWAVGSGNGSLDTGSLAISTWYHVFIIERTDTDVVDVLLSASATAPTMPSSYTKKRRIGSIFTNSSAHINPFLQVGDEFYWGAALQDMNVSNPGTSARTITLTVPTGVVVQPICYAALDNFTTNAYWIATSLALADTTPSITAFTFVVGQAGGAIFPAGGLFKTWTNTSAQIRVRRSASGTNDVELIITHGWIDPRGRLA